MKKVSCIFKSSLIGINLPVHIIKMQQHIIKYSFCNYKSYFPCFIDICFLGNYVGKDCNNLYMIQIFNYTQIIYVVHWFHKINLLVARIKWKTKIYHPVGTVPKFIRKITETETKFIPITNIYMMD